MTQFDSTEILLYRWNDQSDWSVHFDFTVQRLIPVVSITINGEKQTKIENSMPGGWWLKVAVVPKVVDNQVALEEVTKES